MCVEITTVEMQSNAERIAVVKKKKKLLASVIGRSLPEKHECVFDPMEGNSVKGSFHHLFPFLLLLGQNF